MQTVVLYHDSCMDGSTSAWAAHTVIPEATYIPVRHGEKPPSLPGCGRLYVVDFSYKRAQIVELAKSIGEVIVLDHHKTAEADLVGWADCPTNVKLVFDMNRSGARITWDYFHPGTTPPPVVAYTNDHDLWKFELPHSRDIRAWRFSSFGYSIRDVEAVHNALRDPDEFCAAIKGGRAFRLADNIAVARHFERGAIVSYGGNQVFVTCSADLGSDIGNYALQHKNIDFAVIYSDVLNKGIREFQLRSRKSAPGDKDAVDVSAVAQQFGGGGHAAAAGFSTRLDEPNPFLENYTHGS